MDQELLQGGSVGEREASEEWQDPKFRQKQGKGFCNSGRGASDLGSLEKEMKLIGF